MTIFISEYFDYKGTKNNVSVNKLRHIIITASLRSIRCKKQAFPVRKRYSVPKTASSGTRRVFQGPRCIKPPPAVRKRIFRGVPKAASCPPDASSVRETAPALFVRSGPFHHFLRPANAELVSGGPFTCSFDGTRYQKQASLVRNMRAVLKKASCGTRRIFRGTRCSKQAPTVQKRYSVHKTTSSGTRRIFKGPQNSRLHNNCEQPPAAPDASSVRETAPARRGADIKRG